MKLALTREQTLAGGKVVYGLTWRLEAAPDELQDLKLYGLDKITLGREGYSPMTTQDLLKGSDEIFDDIAAAEKRVALLRMAGTELANLLRSRRSWNGPEELEL
jgi:hypothetical protein